MNIEQSIKSRRDAFSSVYELTPEAEKEVNELFARIEEFGKTCEDGLDFEAKFATSELNTEYINMFTKLSTTCKCKMQPVEDNPNVESDAEYYAREAAEDLEYLANSATQPLRHEAYEKSKEALRSTEVGNALFNLNNNLENANHLRKLFSKKSKD